MKNIKQIRLLIVFMIAVGGPVTAWATPPPPPPPPIGTAKAKVRVSASMFQGEEFKYVSTNCEFETDVFIYENVPQHVNTSVLGEECRSILGALNFKAEVGMTINRNTANGKKELMVKLLARTTEGDWDSQSLIRTSTKMTLQDNSENNEVVDLHANGLVYRKPLSEKTLNYIDVYVTAEILR